tara:strand:+ start:961 stop:1239 length:279 start_codon:yes stop_codon:yes gene_type:complete
MTVHFTFTALGKTIDVYFYSNGNNQNLIITFDGALVSNQSGDILNYPDSFLLLNGAAAKKWEKKQLRLIAEETIAAFIEMAIETCELDPLNP